MIDINDDKIYFAKMKENAIIPSKKKEDAGYDLYACFDEDYFVIEPFKTRPVPTGIACAFHLNIMFRLRSVQVLVRLALKKARVLWIRVIGVNI